MRKLQVPVPSGFGFPLGFLLGVLVTMVTVALGATREPVMSVVALVAVVDLVALTSTFRATLGTALVCWALHAGFVLGRHGEIAFTGQSGQDALVLLLIGAAASGFAGLLRVYRRHERPTARIPVQR